MVASNGIPFAIASSGIGWMLAILGLLVWMLFHPRKAFGPRSSILIMGFLAIGPICAGVLNSENAHNPLKFDYFLYRVEQRVIGISAFSMAQLFTQRQQSILFQLYESLTMAMVAWYGST